MRVKLGLVVALALALSLLAPATVVAKSGSQTYELHLEVPNTAQAPNGDQVAVTGEGTFSVFPKSVTANGEFTHTRNGNPVAEGTWVATQLLAFQLYGCGVLFGDPIPSNFCGGMLKLRVQLTLTAPPALAGDQTDGILTVYCLIGDRVPASAEEGVKLLVPGIINFNDVTGGENVYIKNGGG